MIAVCGLNDEEVVKYYLAYLLYHNIPCFFIDERKLGTDIRIRFEISDGKIVGEIKMPSWSISLDEITGYYNRLGMNHEVADYYQTEDYLNLELLLNLVSKPVCNRPSSLLSNSSKLSQFPYIIQSGLSVPNSFLGYNSAIRDSFFKNEEKIIVKSASSVRSIVKPINYQDLDSSYRTVPHQYQACLDGHNIRVHLIGDTVLACKIMTKALDYRYSHSYGSDFSMIPFTLPDEIKESCIKLNELLTLTFSGIDLFLSTSRKWYCFEVNTSPGYSWFEEHSGLQISETITNYLK